VLGILSPEDATAFEDHYLTCAACAGIVEATEEYVRAMRAAGREGARSVSSESIAVGRGGFLGSLVRTRGAVGQFRRRRPR
jgi:hypothetical protein